MSRRQLPNRGEQGMRDIVIIDAIYHLCHVQNQTDRDSRLRWVLSFIAVSKTMSSSGSDSLWPASKRQLNRSRDRRHAIEDTHDFGTAQSTRGQMLRGAPQEQSTSAL